MSGGLGPGSVALAVLLTAWLALTVLAALPVAGEAVRRITPDWFDPLVPSWTFFAPRPATMDRVLLYRDLLPGRTFGALREVWPADSAMPGIVGHFSGRTGKAATDAMEQLLVFSARHREQLVTPRRPTATRVDERQAAGLMLSTPYLLLLNRVTAAPHDAIAIGVQFVITTTNMLDEDPQAMFVSGVHTLDACLAAAC